MRLAVMGRSIRPGLSGVGRHALGLVRGLAENAPDVDLSVFLTRDAPPLDAAGVTELRAPLPTPNEYARALWEQTVVPLQASRRGIEVYHSPNYILPAALRCPSVVTVHDLTYLDRSLHRWTSHHYLSAMTAAALRQATAVVAVSEYTRRLVEAHYPHTEGRVRVIYQGLAQGMRRPEPAAVEAFRERKAFGHPYVLYVGTIEPRKNVARLIQAFERAVAAGSLPHHLYLAGAWGWKAGPVADALAASPLAARIHRTGYLEDAELPLWYAAADAFVYPSLEEGFGLPPLEAMACGAPVVTANTSSLPEVVGDAALTVDPTDLNALAGAMAGLCTDPPLRSRLRLAGLQRAARFTWAQSAREHLALYRTVAAGGRQPALPALDRGP